MPEIKKVTNMKINDYLTYDTVRGLGEYQYNQLRQALKHQGYRITDALGAFNWTATTEVEHDSNKLCLFLDHMGDLNWGEIVDGNLVGEEIALEQALELIERSNVQQIELDHVIACMTVGEVKAKIDQLEQQLEATSKLHQQQYQELTAWRERVRHLLGRATMNLNNQ